MDYAEIMNDPGYEEVAVVEHDGMKSFLQGEIAVNQGWARVANMYQLTGLLAFMLGAFKAFMPFYARREWIYLAWLLAGVVFLFTAGIMLHEAIHALAYRYVGGRNVSFGVNIRKFLFYVQADGEVMDYRRSKIVALAPAVVLSVMALVGMAVCYNQPAFYFFLSILGLHGVCCGGDFGMLCVFQNREPDEVLMFDRRADRRTYFYKKVSKNN